MSDSSEEENIEFLRQAVDNDFFKNSLFRKEEGERVVEEEKIEPIPSLRRKDEYDQFRLFNVTPQFQKYVGNALSEKLEKFLKGNLVECCEKRRKKKKLTNTIKLLHSSKYPIDLESDEVINLKNTVRKIKPGVKNVCINESDLKSIVMTGEEILAKKGTEFWSRRSKAPLFNYIKDNRGILNLIEPEFK